MLKNYPLQIFLLLLFFSRSLIGAIEIRHAEQSDLQSVVAVDRQVSMEYFVPLYTKQFAHSDISKRPAYYLEKELGPDEQFFIEGIAQQNDTRLHVAHDTQTNNIIGFAAFHRINNDLLELDLLLIETAYRKRGIGKKLIISMFTVFQGITMCDAYTFKADDVVHKFYEKMGFVKLGNGPTNTNLHDIPCSDIYYHYRLHLNKSVKTNFPQ